MRRFLTKIEACRVLKKAESGDIDKKFSVSLASIRVCIAGEAMGFDLWGEPVEEARPLFRGCEIPDENSPEDILENYEAYKACIAEATEKFAVKNYSVTKGEEERG